MSSVESYLSVRLLLTLHLQSVIPSVTTLRPRLQTLSINFPEQNSLIFKLRRAQLNLKVSGLTDCWGWSMSRDSLLHCWWILFLTLPHPSLRSSSGLPSVFLAMLFLMTGWRETVVSGLAYCSSCLGSDQVITLSCQKFRAYQAPAG